MIRSEGELVAATGVPVAPRPPTRGWRLPAVLLSMALAPAVAVMGVSAASTPTASAPAGGYSETVYIDIHYSHYDPSLVFVPAGVPIRFVIRNLDPIDHEWIVGDTAVHARHRAGSELHHGARPTELSIAALQTLETVVTFPARGSLQFICHLPGHEQYGMVGALDIRY